MAERSKQLAVGSDMRIETDGADTDVRDVDPDRPVVVGIGASAGGLAALSDLLHNVPPQPGMAFVIVQHLNPERESSLVEILSKRTELPVSEVEEDTAIEQDHVYIIPPGHYLTIEDCHLKLSEPTDPRGSRMAIDHFLTSLAEDTCEFGIGIVLSGTGSDGTAGLRDIKHYGGLTVVQDPDDAEHSGMPDSAIRSVSVDFVLPANEIGARLQSYVQFCKRHGPLSAQVATRAGDSDLTPILDLMRREMDQDFRRYRTNTLMRRIRRRMGLMQLDELSDYLNVLGDNAAEREALGRDLLIGVTRFFRDTEAWQTLEKQLPSLMEGADKRTPLRVWCAGCATGEEAYSVAMLVLEHRERMRRTVPFQIFATDVAEDALATARNGIYPESIGKEVSRERLQRFFKRQPDGFQVSKPLRESVVFANQNVLAQPPFARLDLVVCRNLLIYFRRDAQARVLDVFQFALKEGGLMFLGATESIAKSGDLFQTISKKHRLFRRTAVRSWPPSDTTYQPSVWPPAPPSDVPGGKSGESRRDASLAASVQRQLFQQLDRAVAVANEDGKVLFVEGQVDQYLQLNTGELAAELPDLLQVARRGIKAKLRSALRRAWASRTAVEIAATVQREDGFQNCQIHVSRLLGRPDDDPAMMIVFTPSQTAGELAASEASSDIQREESDPSEATGTQPHVVELEHELATTREQLSSSIAELESANEELKASNEEALTMNEELQSGNEELETSKEELQSLNEELSTMNNQLEIKVGELEQTTNDLQNFLASSDVPTLFLDPDFYIRRYTPACGELLHMIPADVGRPLADINSRFDDPNLLDDARAVLRDLQPRERQVASHDGKRWFQRRILPYRTDDDRIQGVVMTMTDVTELLTAQQQAEHQLAQNRNIYASAPIGLAFVDTDLRYVSVNQHLADINGVPVDGHVGKRVHDILPPALADSVIRTWQKILKNGEEVRNLEVSGKTEATDEQRDYLVNYVPLKSSDGGIQGINIVVQDISERKRSEQATQRSEQFNRAVLESTPDCVKVLDSQLRIISMNQPGMDLLDIDDFDSVKGKAYDDFWPADQRESLRAAAQTALDGGEGLHEGVCPTVKGVRKYWRVTIRHVENDGDHLVAISRDITEQHESEIELKESRSRLRAFLDNAPVMMGVVEIPPDERDILHLLDNRAAEQFVDAAPGETVEKWSVADLNAPPEKVAELMPYYREALRLGQPVSFIFEAGKTRPPDHDENVSNQWLNTTISHLGQGDEGRQRFCYIASDDTQRVQAEEELLRSYETFSSLIHDAPFGVYVLDDQMNFVAVSREARRVFATEETLRGEPLEKWLRQIWPDEFVDDVMPHFWHTLHSGEPFESAKTVETRRDHGGREAYHWTLQRVNLPEGRSGVVCHFYGLSELRAAELSARQSEGRLRLALDLADFGVITVDYRRDTAMLDERAAEIFRLPAETEVSRSRLHGQFHPDDRAWVLQKVEETRRDPTSKAVSLQHRLRLPDGTLRWVDICKRMAFADENATDAQSCTVVVLDVTERKAHEENLEAARLAAEEAKQQAEAANRARGEFLANMSHEIRTPMTAILGYAELLGEHLSDPDNQQCVQTIRRNGRFLLDIINDILDLSKIDAGKVKLAAEPVKPAAIMADIVSLMNVRAEEQNIKLKAQFDGKIPERIHVDAKRLKQVLLNLTGNAIKFTDDGEVKIVCRFEQNENEHGTLVFDVIDTGIGIAPDRLDALFEPFVQVDQSHTRSFGGTGLGLAISRRLARLLGGDITAESRPGEGSRFTLQLDPGPIDGVPLVRPNLLASPQEGSVETPNFAGHCLIVDDRRDIRFLAQHFIEQAGGTVSTANDGREGVDTLQQLLDTGSAVDVILMDMQMPVMDGYEAVSEIRRRGIELPIIALTANAMAEDREKCLEAGCTDFLTKPLDRMQLFEMLARLA